MKNKSDKDDYFKDLLEMDRLTPDGTFTVPSQYSTEFDLRGAIAESDRLGRPLTVDEMKQFEHKRGGNSEK